MMRLTAAILGGIAVLSANAAEPPSAQELLAKFAAGQDQLKSYIVQYDASTTFLDTPAPFTSYSAGEMRCDSRHMVDRSRIWGRLNPRLEQSRDKPRYGSRLVDDQFVYSYGRDFQFDKDVGTLFLQDASAVAASHESPLVNGSPLIERLCVGRDHYRRIDERLREATVIRVHDKLEPAGWDASSCYVLEANTRHGQYILWLDPAHGYNMAKAVRRCRPGDLRPNDKPYEQREAMLGTVDKVRFEQREGIWVPMEFTSTIDETDAMGRRSQQTNHFRATQFTVNPDHVALKSFVPDDVADGAVVTMDVGNGPNHKKLGIWRAGRIEASGSNMLSVSEAFTEGKCGNTP